MVYIINFSILGGSMSALSNKKSTEKEQENSLFYEGLAVVKSPKKLTRFWLKSVAFTAVGYGTFKYGGMGLKKLKGLFTEKKKK